VAEGRGVRDELVVEPDALVTGLAVEMVAEPTETDPMATPEGRGANRLQVGWDKVGGGRVRD
jgi:hypothetical protein